MELQSVNLIKSISGPLAGIFGAWLEEEFIKKAQIIFLKRMKDNIFFVWKLDKNASLEEFKKYLNSLEPSTQFTLEIEVHLNRILNFADL